MSDRLAWERDGADWPNRAASAFVEASGLRWHVQRMGSGPVALLLHGTGASTHSWRDLAPLLASRFSVIAPDLPGHAFTETPPFQRMTLPGMAADIRALMQVLDAQPAVAVGHSAGAAILARMSLDGALAARTLISLNGALLPFGGVPGRLFSPLARLLATSSLAPRLFAWRAGDRAVVERLIRDTGSRLDPLGADLYARLARNPPHVAAALAMMANWDLDALARELPRLAPALVLVTGSNDHTIPSASAYRVHALLPASKVVRLSGLGHLAHEEQPRQIADLVTDAAQATGLPL